MLSVAAFNAIVDVAIEWKLAQPTLSIQEVADGNGVRSICDVRCFEHLLHVCLRLDAHVLLPESLRLLLEACILLQKIRTRFRE